MHKWDNGQDTKREPVDGKESVVREDRVNRNLHFPEQ